MLSGLLVLVFAALPEDQESVRKHIMDHYIAGMYTGRDAQAMRAGFHPQFRMIVWWEGQLTLRPRDAWIDKVTSNPRPTPEKIAATRVEIPLVWVVGDAAAARIEIYRGEQHRYTDFFTLYRIDGQWQVMAKTFHYHPGTTGPKRAIAAEQAAVENLIEARYMMGFARGFKADSMRKGFHRDFRMATWWQNELTLKGRETWIGKITQGKAKPDHRAKWSWQIPQVEVAGDAALARIELSHDGHLMFTDFFLLYRFPEGWRVVEKAFHYVPKPES